MAFNRKIFSRAYHKLVETRWLFTFTASCTATIVGIALTFGINSCRNSRIAEQEAKESLEQAVGNLRGRTIRIADFLDQIYLQDSLYNIVIDLHMSNQSIPDSIAKKFATAVCTFEEYTNNTSYERLYRESYQMWQVLSQDDLADKIDFAYDIINVLENYCETSNAMLLEKMGQCKGASHAFISANAQELTKALISSDDFCFYMSARAMKSKSMKGFQEDQYEVMEEIDSICKSLNYQIKEVEVK